MASSADLSRFFVDDDEETLSVLVSSKASADLPGRLEGLVKRFQEDQDPTWDTNWNINRQVRSGPWVSSFRPSSPSVGLPLILQLPCRLPLNLRTERAT